jgi:hypothetical protein
LGRLKLRCIACERAGPPMTKEHFWPRWLTQRAGLGRTGKIRWIGQKVIPAAAATLPICADCNNSFGSQLEGPASRIFADMEAGYGISDPEAEILVRWLWKFEGLVWTTEYHAHPEWRYSSLWTLKERVLGQSVAQIRPELVLAIALIEKNDEGFDDWPIGIDSPIVNHNAIFVSGVFCQTALMVLLNEFRHLVPPEFKLYQLDPIQQPEGSKVFFPKIGFERAEDAVVQARLASIELFAAHESFSRQRNQARRLMIPHKPRIEIP